MDPARVRGSNVFDVLTAGPERRELTTEAALHARYFVRWASQSQACGQISFWARPPIARPKWPLPLSSRVLRSLEHTRPLKGAHWEHGTKSSESAIMLSTGHLMFCRFTFFLTTGIRFCVR